MTKVFCAVAFIFALFSTVIPSVQADGCGDLIRDYSRNMTTAVCHQAAAIIFANFEGVWEKSVARSENSITIQAFREEVFSEGPSTTWMGTIWQYVDNKAPFAPHSFTIHRSEDRMFRLWSAYADAYSGGFTLNNWLEDPPGWGWSVFAGGVSMKEKDFELFFNNSAIAYDRNAVQDDRIAADWATWMPDSLFGYTWSYGYGYTNDTSYQVAYYKTSGIVSDERCAANAPVVEKMRPDCFDNSQTCIQFMF